MTVLALNMQKSRAMGHWGPIALCVCAGMVAVSFSTVALADGGAKASSGLASSVPSASSLPKVDDSAQHDDEGAVPFQDLDDQRRILEAARKALAIHSRNVHESMSVSSNDIDNKQLLDRDATMRLVGIYENMRPRDAAAVFNVMDPHILVAIAAEMNTRKLSAIMAQMSRDRVNMVSQYLVGVRRFHQKNSSSSGEGEKLPSGLIITGPQNNPYSAKSMSSGDSTPLMPSRQ